MSEQPIKSVHWLTGTDATEKANNMLGLGWDILETGMDPYGEPTFLMGWSVWMENPPAAALTPGDTPITNCGDVKQIRLTPGDTKQVNTHVAVCGVNCGHVGCTPGDTNE